MADRLKNKVAIITGSSSGIGRATVLRFVQEGAKVVGADRNRTGGEETQQMALNLTPDVEFVPVDVSKAEQVQSLVRHAEERFGRLDILVNVAGIFINSPLLAEVDERDWDLMMATNLKGVFLCCKYTIPVMLRGGGGSIVNISSLAGILPGPSLPYNVSKAGVTLLTMSAANQYSRQGIRINAIAPGPVDTPQMRSGSISPEGFKTMEARTPLGRAGRPEELADAILFLASDESSFVTGTTLVVDGGYIVGSL